MEKDNDEHVKKLAELQLIREQLSRLMKELIECRDFLNKLTEMKNN